MFPPDGAHPADWTLAAGVRVRSTGCAQGDLAGATGTNAGGKVERRRRAVVDLPWTVLEQVHGARVVVVERPGAAAGTEADAAVTTASGAVLAVLTADCAPVAFASPESILGVAHAGWRGLRAGVVEATVTTMRRLGATRIEAVLGPCIHPCCYSFGSQDLDRLAARLGEQVRTVDRGGAPAFDLPGGVKTALHSSGVVLVGESDTCTSCSGDHWSWRRSAVPFRQATVVWRQ
jgi:YfiH family protein